MNTQKLALALLLSCLALSRIPAIAALEGQQRDGLLYDSGNLQGLQRNLKQDMSSGMGGGDMSGGGGGGGSDNLIPYHGWIMTAAFGIIFPAGVALPLIFRGSRVWPIAFQIHRIVQIVGALFIVAGLGLGAKLNVNSSPQQVHKGIGIAVFALVWLQGLSGLFVRPVLHGRARGLYTVLHWWAGRTSIVVGIGNAYYGMNISQPATRYYVGFSVAIGAWLLIAIIGQFIVHAFYNYDHNGRIVLEPIGKISNTKAIAADGSRYRHVVVGDDVGHGLSP